MDNVENKYNDNGVDPSISVVNESEMEDVMFARLSPGTLYHAPSCYGSYEKLSQTRECKCSICPVRPPCFEGKALEVRRMKKGLYR